MTDSAISTTDRRSIHPAVQSISLETQPAPLRCALPSLQDQGVTTRRHFFMQGVAGRPAMASRQVAYGLELLAGVRLG